VPETWRVTLPMLNGSNCRIATSIFRFPRSAKIKPVHSADGSPARFRTTAPTLCWSLPISARARPSYPRAPDPRIRARQTLDLFRAQGGATGDDPVGIDERLREKEFGILDGLTTSGVASVYPDQAEFRRILGKFYHRPPGGESWCDVIFRLRSLMDTIALHYAGRRVMIVAHQVVVLCLRYVIENLTEEEILAIDLQGDVANCSVTEYRFDPEGPQGGALKLVRYNDVVDHEGSAPITAEPDRTTGVRG
jgi:broad specificity phosphatase PhoE